MTAAVVGLDAPERVAAALDRTRRVGWELRRVGEP